MLEFTSLFLALPVVHAHGRHDTVMHTSLLGLLCTSVLHHASGRKYDRTVGRVDRILCVANALLCFARLWPFPQKRDVLCLGLGAYISYVYYGKLAKKSKSVHASMHACAAIINLWAVERL